MPECVSDASTLILMAALGRFPLLRRYAGTIVIPPAVWAEVVIEGQGKPGARETAEAADEGWITVVAPTNAAHVLLLQRDLDDGEAEAIALAVERKASLVLIDESEGRRVADLHGLKKTGVVGLLTRAKAEGELGSLRHELDELRDRCGFWLADDLYERALRAVGESPWPVGTREPGG